MAPLFIGAVQKFIYLLTYSERIKKHVLTPLRWNGRESFCGFRGQQRKQM